MPAGSDLAMKSFSTTHRLAVLVLGGLVLLGVTVTVSAQRGDGSSDADIFRGKSLREIDALVQQISDESERKTIQATADFVARGDDPRSLRRAEQFSIAASPPSTFEESLARAELIVVAEVRSLDLISARAAGRGGTLATLAVRDVLLGGSIDTLVLQQPATVEIDVEGKSATGLVLSVPSFAPALFAGDKALLLLKKADGSEYYYALPFVGQYVERADGKLEAVGGNPFQGQFAGLTLAQGAEKVRAALQK